MTHYEQPITINQAITHIKENTFLLPALQRQFVWSPSQIEQLFDSLLQGYPINTFMKWKVKDKDIKNNYKFYSFIKDYIQLFATTNPDFSSSGSEDFYAIIDGQQRLTSIYIGLCGTYASKLSRKRWPKRHDEQIMPTKKLYIDLLKEKKSEGDSSKYSLAFLSASQVHKTDKHHWFCLHDFLGFADYNDSVDYDLEARDPYLAEHKLTDNAFAKRTLSLLYTTFKEKPIIHAFVEDEQNLDKVLDIFIRTNSGGTSLSYSDLLVSIIIANWQGDFRKELADLIEGVRSEHEFHIDRDWILKSSLMLADLKIQLKVENFNKEDVKKIQAQWSEIKRCIYQSFRLATYFGINNEALTSKNALIPLAYYIYKKEIYETIDNTSKHEKNREVMAQWLYMALLSGFFGRQGDTTLLQMRNIIQKHLQDELFPLKQVIDAFKRTSKDLRFNEERIEGLLDITYGDPTCISVLHLIFPNKKNFIYHIDHLHPQKSFDEKKLKKSGILVNLPDNKKEYYEDPVYRNSIPNLHLLDESANKSKGKKSLVEWVEQKGLENASSLLVPRVSLEFENFPKFYDTRRKSLKEILMSKLPIMEDTEDIEDDEE